MTDDIRPFLKVLLAAGTIKQKDIVSATNYSKSAISMWINGGYNRNGQQLENAVREFLKPYIEADSLSNLSARDQRRLTDLLSILDDAEDRTSLIAALARFSPSRDCRHDCTTA